MDEKEILKNYDMQQDLREDAFVVAKEALNKFSIENEIACFIKEEFDKRHNPTWHCVVGRNFGSYVTYDSQHFIFFYLGQIAVLLYKCG